MRGTLLKSALLVAAVLVAAPSFAADERPEAKLKALVVDLMSALNEDGASAANARDKVEDLLERRGAPVFDFARMARFALARNWQLATAEQQARLVAEFKTVLMLTYAAALSSYRDHTIEFEQMRPSAGRSGGRVKSETRPSQGRQLSIDYDLELTSAGWQVYDLKFGGASLIATYREIFAQAIRERGVDGLIEALAQSNRHADFALKPAVGTSRDQSRIMFAMLQSALRGRR